MNAIQSIQVGVEDYLMEDRRRYLSAVRNISAGVLLLYKEKLCQLSPNYDKEILIKKDIRPEYNDKGDVIFAGNGKKTVDVHGIKERFKGLNIEVNWTEFDELNRLRNDIEHYYTDESLDTVREIIAKSCVLIRDFIRKYLQEEPRQLLGDKCWQDLLKIENVYEVEKQACKESLDRVDWRYKILKDASDKIRCPDCYSGLIEVVRKSRRKSSISGKSKYSASTHLVCKSCGKDFKFRDIAEQCLLDSLATDMYIAMKDGGEEPLGMCSHCGCHTYLLNEERCVLCNHKRSNTTCERCGTDLLLSKDYYCSYCEYQFDKMMAE
jgi:ribosomal protein L37E